MIRPHARSNFLSPDAGTNPTFAPGPPEPPVRRVPWLGVGAAVGAVMVLGVGAVLVAWAVSRALDPGEPSGDAASAETEAASGDDGAPTGDGGAATGGDGVANEGEGAADGDPGAASEGEGAASGDDRSTAGDAGSATGEAGGSGGDEGASTGDGASATDGKPPTDPATAIPPPKSASGTETPPASGPSGSTPSPTPGPTPPSASKPAAPVVPGSAGTGTLISEGTRYCTVRVDGKLLEPRVATPHPAGALEARCAWENLQEDGKKEAVEVTASFDLAVDQTIHLHCRKEKGSCEVR